MPICQAGIRNLHLSYRPAKKFVGRGTAIQKGKWRVPWNMPSSETVNGAPVSSRTAALGNRAGVGSQRHKPAESHAVILASPSMPTMDIGRSQAGSEFGGRVV